MIWFRLDFRRFLESSLNKQRLVIEPRYGYELLAKFFVVLLLSILEVDPGQKVKKI